MTWFVRFVGVAYGMPCRATRNGPGRRGEKTGVKLGLAPWFALEVPVGIRYVFRTSAGVAVMRWWCGM